MAQEFLREGIDYVRQQNKEIGNFIRLLGPDGKQMDLEGHILHYVANVESPVKFAEIVEAMKNFGFTSEMDVHNANISLHGEIGPLEWTDDRKTRIRPIGNYW